MTAQPQSTLETRHIGILLFDDVEELDAVGPWEVLAARTHFHPQDGWAVSCLSADGGIVRCAEGLLVGAHHRLADAPPLDVLIHPGGIGTRPMLSDDKHLERVGEQRRQVPLMTSVCSGSLVYAAAGLLAGRPATTHWAAVGALAALDATVRIDETARYVDDGDVITSAGVSAGIDMALYLIERLVSAERARDVQYDHGPYPQAARQAVAS